MISRNSMKEAKILQVCLLIQLLHTPPLNTFGLVKYPPPRVDNSAISMERGVATIVLLYTYTESVEEKNYDEEGKEMKKERKRGKCVAGWI